jgi:hypothetical protein
MNSKSLGRACGTNVVLVLDASSLDPTAAGQTIQAALLTRETNWLCDLDVGAGSGSCVDQAGEDVAFQW